MERTEDRSYVEAIKFAASFLQYKNISVKQTFGSAVSQLYWYYKHLNDRNGVCGKYNAYVRCGE